MASLFRVLTQQQVMPAAAPSTHLQCVCALCTCGRHHCTAAATKKTVAVPFSGETCYHESFVPHAIDVKDRRKRTPPPPPQPVKFEGTSTHRADYQQWEMERKKAVVGKARTAVQVPFTGSTTHKADYVPHAMEVKVKAGPHYEAPVPVKFEGTTTHRDAFTPKEAPKRAMVEVRRSQPVTIPFSGTTTHHSDYVKHPLGPKPAPRAMPHAPEPVKFEATTNHRDSYQPPPPREKQARPTAREYVRPHVAHDWSTTHRQDFVRHSLEGPKRVHAVHQLATKTPFAGTTNHRDDYKDWGVCPVLKLPPVPKPEERAAGLGGGNPNHVFFDSTRNGWAQKLE